MNKPLIKTIFGILPAQEYRSCYAGAYGGFLEGNCWCDVEDMVYWRLEKLQVFQ